MLLYSRFRRQSDKVHRKLWIDEVTFGHGIERNDGHVIVQQLLGIAHILPECLLIIAVSPGLCQLTVICRTVILAVVLGI